MQTNFRPVNLYGKPFRSVEDVAEMVGVNQWTIRLWMDRLDIPYTIDSNGGIVLSAHAAEQIVTISRLVKTKGLNIDGVRKYLETGVLDLRQPDKSTADGQRECAGDDPDPE